MKLDIYAELIVNLVQANSITPIDLFLDGTGYTFHLFEESFIKDFLAYIKS